MDKAKEVALNVSVERALVSMKIGSQEHRDAFCAHFTQTYVEYDPKTLPWPELDDVVLRRLQSVPFWEEVFYTERRAGAIVAAFTETVSDPVLKGALALQDCGRPQGSAPVEHARGGRAEHGRIATAWGTSCGGEGPSGARRSIATCFHIVRFACRYFARGVSPRLASTAGLLEYASIGKDEAKLQDYSCSFELI